MKSFLNKAWGLLALSVVATTGAQADQAANGQIAVMPVDSCATTCCTTEEPCYGYAYNPPVFFEDCCGWYAEVEFLYWKACQDGISYGAVSSLKDVQGKLGPVSIDYPGDYNTTFKHPKFDWESGFRVGLGYRTPCDCWEAKLSYTHYRTNCDASHTSSGNFNEFHTADRVSGSVFAPAYSSLSESTVIPQDFEHFKVSNDWKVHFNQIDLDFGREFFVGRCVTLRPYAGLRASFIELKYAISNESIGTNMNATLDTVSKLNQYVRMDNDFKGVGLKYGLESTYGLGCGLALYGQAEGSLVYGEFDVIQREEVNLVVTDPQATSSTTTNRYNNNMNDTFDCLLPQVDMSVGLRWRQMINCDRNAFTLKLGWEHHALFDYNKLRNFSFPQRVHAANNTPSGNLYFYGITFSASVDF